MIDKPSQTPPRILTGGVIGGLLMAGVIGLSYLGSRAADLPSITDDFFAWIRDLLPGNIITISIDAMVDTLSSFNAGDNLDNIAKMTEQFTSYVMVVTLGVAAGLALFGFLQTQNARSWNSILIPGLVGGLALGGIMSLISSAKRVITSLINPESLGVIDVLWILALFTAFGFGLSWTYHRLITMAAAEDTKAASVERLDRRRFLVQVGGAAAVVTVIGVGLGRLLNEDSNGTTTVDVPDTDSLTQVEATPEADSPAQVVSADGFQPAPGTRPEYTPLDDHYRIDISTRPPEIRESEWALLVTGLVAEDTMLTLADLRNNYEPVDQIVTLSCISNRVGGDLISTTRWTGVPLKTLLEGWNVLPEARYMRITAADGFDEYVSLNLIRQDERVMLTYAWDGKPLKEKHGFPLRIYIPDHYGMKQPKWIIGIEMVSEWQEGYWVRRGWSDTAIMRTTSALDTVAVNDIFEQDSQLYVPVGGIAHGGARGISKVEVSVDDGEWVEARLKDPLSELTWVIWRYDWPFAEGQRTFRVRTYDGRGVLQITNQNEASVDGRRHGAVGIHSMRATVTAPDETVSSSS